MATEGPVATLILLDIAEQSRMWGFSRFVVGRFDMDDIPGLQFFKVLGSGEDGGFVVDRIEEIVKETLSKIK
jgi:spheroidene monooxygenase